MGEPLATLPPMVPALRIGGEAKRSQTSVRLGTRCSQRARRRSRARRRRRCRAASVAALLDRLHLGHVADVDDVAQVAELLVDPQADVGGAGQQLRRRLGLAQRGELGQRRGRVEVVDALAQRRGVVEAGLVLQALQRGHHRLGVQPHRRQVEHALAGIEDRPVAGAAAQVAREIVGQLLARRAGVPRGLVVLVGGPQRHHEARRAEAALRAVAVDHRLLHRMQVYRRLLVARRPRRAGGCTGP